MGCCALPSPVLKDSVEEFWNGLDIRRVKTRAYINKLIVLQNSLFSEETFHQITLTFLGHPTMVEEKQLFWKKVFTEYSNEMSYVYLALLFLCSSEEPLNVKQLARIDNVLGLGGVVEGNVDTVLIENVVRVYFELISLFSAKYTVLEGTLDNYDLANKMALEEEFNLTRIEQYTKRFCSRFDHRNFISFEEFDEFVYKICKDDNKMRKNISEADSILETTLD